MTVPSWLVSSLPATPCPVPLLHLTPPAPHPWVTPSSPQHQVQVDTSHNAEACVPRDGQQATQTLGFHPHSTCFSPSFPVPGNGASRVVDEDPTSLPPFSVSHQQVLLVLTQRSNWNATGPPPPHSHAWVLGHQPLTGHTNSFHICPSILPLESRQG